MPEMTSQDLMLAEMRELYRDAFGRYPSAKQERIFLAENPGAVALWEKVNDRQGSADRGSEEGGEQ